MSIWCLYPRTGKNVYQGYDAIQTIVVRAPNERSARLLASQQAKAEGQKVWLDDTKTVCEHVLAKGPQDVLCIQSRDG